METLYFTLGIASVVVTAFAVGTIWVIFKVTKINSRLREIEDQFGSAHREIEMVEQTIMNNMHNNLTDVYATTDRISIEMNQTADELTRYVDSRVDKIAAKAAKEFING